MTHHDPNRPHTDPAARPGYQPGASPADDPLNPPEPVIHDAAPVRSGAEARQARPGLPVLYVLLGGLVLALIAWAAVELYPRGGPQTAITQPEPRDLTATTPPTAGNIPITPPPGKIEERPRQAQPPASAQGTAPAETAPAPGAR